VDSLKALDPERPIREADVDPRIVMSQSAISRHMQRSKLHSIRSLR
jgi:hypothetical protein